MVLLALMDIACIVFCLALGFCILGLVIGRLFRWPWIFRHGAGFSAVVGLAGCILFLEVWNFFFPVSHASVVALTCFTLGSVAIFRRTILGVIRTWIRSSSGLVTVSLLLLLLTVSLFGLGPSEHGHYDTGLYYLNSIRWAHEYPVVPGLANLHSRLGYNQSLFLFIAFLSSAGNLGLARACQVVNPLFILISGWAILDRVRLNLITAKAKRVRLYAVFLLGPLFFLSTHIWVSAPTADIAAAVLALPGALAFFCCLEEVADRNQLEAQNWVLLLAFSAFTIAKLKLSYLVLGGVAIGISAIALSFLQPRYFLWVWIRTGTLGATLMLPWMARGVVLTGYPFYPSTFIRFRTDWAISRRNAEGERKWIYSWARMPDEDPSRVLKDNSWFKPWFERNLKYPENVFLLLFLAGGAVSGLLSFLTPMNRERRLITILLLVPAGFALVFWFKTAPDPRFGYASLLLCGVNGFYSFSSAISALSPVRSGLCACIVTVGSLGFITRTQFPLISSVEEKFPQGFPKAELEFQTTNSGLRIGVPKDIQAWNAGLVVTPYFDPNLAFRGRDLRDGFRLMPEKSLPNELPNK